MNNDSQLDLYYLEKTCELDLQVYKQKVEIEYLKFKTSLLEESVAFYRKLAEMRGL